MTKEEILQTFWDINHAYNNSTKYDTLKRMLDELTEPYEDCISRQAGEGMEEEERKRAMEAVEALIKKIDNCLMSEDCNPKMDLNMFDLCFIKHCIVEHVKQYEPKMFDEGG